MRSSQLALEQYDSDKAASGGSLEQYDPILEPWLGKRIVLLELGIGSGGSLLLWRDYFPLGTIVGVDTHLPKAFRPTERIHLYEGSQIDLEFLSRVGNGIAPDGFDIIIDDASHVGELSKTTFWHLFEKHLKSGGLYAIEDWGTGYWDDWPDGKKLDPDSHFRTQRQTNPDVETLGQVRRALPLESHQHGMVGFIKQLVDEQGAHDATKRGPEGMVGRESRFASITIVPSIVFVKKS